MADHTPGPWEVRGRSNDDEMLVCNESGPDTLIVAIESENLDADARLIAAAPDLLAAAKDFLEASPMARAWPSYRGLRAAIAKATGEAS